MIGYIKWWLSGAAEILGGIASAASDMIESIGAETIVDGISSIGEAANDAIDGMSGD